MLEQNILEPSKYYHSFLKEEHAHNVEEKFDNLIKEANISKDEALNFENIVLKEKATLDDKEKNLKKLKRKATLLLVFGILLIVIIVGIFLLIKRKKSVMPLLKHAEQERDNQVSKYKKAVIDSRNYMAPLFNLFNDNIATELVHKTTPIISFKDRLDSLFMSRIIDQFKYKEDVDISHSANFVLAGEVQTNPFFIKRYYETHMLPEIYTGTLIITYQVSYHTDHGTETRTVTQTLVAHYTAPKPHYGYNSELYYFNEGAPRLSFSRSPTDLACKDDRAKQKYIDKFEKEDAKKAQKAIKHGGQYTAMANAKFEAYWNSKNRTNEVEYRLLFTALAQTNLIDYLDNKYPYGDDFTFYKLGMINVISSSHSLGLDYSGSVANYDGDIISVVEKNFKDYNNTFFSSLYYDLCPVLSIPLYQENISSKYLKGDIYYRNVPNYIAEILANRIDRKILHHPSTTTDSIIKTELVKKCDGYDMINIIAYSYEAVPQVTLIPTLGGDGKMHPVPVHYFIYENRKNVTPALIYKNYVNNKQNGIIVNYKGYSLIINK